jgi:hypothetical protein
MCTPHSKDYITVQTPRFISCHWKLSSVTKNLKSISSAGFDEVPEFLIKQCILYIKKPLVLIFNASFNSGIFLDEMKIAKLRPVFKKRR